MKAKTETELIADCHGGTEVNLVVALGFYSKFGSLESLLNLEQKHEMVTAISVEMFPGVLQTEQKHIGKWREVNEVEMNIRHSETYRRPDVRVIVQNVLSSSGENQREELELILGKKFMGYASGNFCDFERQKQKGSTVTDYNAVDENDEVHRVMKEMEPLLEAPGKRNWRSIMSTHDEFPCHCLLQTW